MVKAEEKRKRARLRDITCCRGEWVWEVDEKRMYSHGFFQKGSGILWRSNEDIKGNTPFNFMPPMSRLYL